jgi:thioredoxin reductase (NADPH)
MVTAEEIARIEVFSELDAVALERLSRVAADITLLPGEYAAQEGDERALFALVEGRIEAVKSVDGLDRVVGERHPGDIFGEVPITLGTVFPVGFRAAEPSRVMRIEPRDYHAVAAVAPDVGREVGRLAADRMGGARGLQGIAAEPPPPRAIVFGKRADARCAELRRFLERNQVSYRWVSPESPDAADVWGGPLPDEGDCPIIRLVGGKTVVTSCARRPSSSPAACRGGASPWRGSTVSPARASSTARRAATHPTRTDSTSTSSAPATRRGRRPCSSRRMPAQ